MRKQLRKRNHPVRLAEILETLVELTAWFDDEGPSGEGWQSKELSQARSRAELAARLLRRRDR